TRLVRCATSPGMALEETFERRRRHVAALHVDLVHAFAARTQRMTCLRLLAVEDSAAARTVDLAVWMIGRNAGLAPDRIRQRRHRRERHQPERHRADLPEPAEKCHVALLAPRRRRG